MTILSIILTTTDIARIIHPSVSLYRLLLISATLLAIVYTIGIGEIPKGRYLYFILLLLLGSPIAYFISTNKEWAFSFMLNDMMGICLVYLVCAFFTLEDKDKLLRAFIYSQVFTLVCSGYSLFMYYVRGGIPQNIQILNIIKISLTEQALVRGTISGHIRLFLPYATPPHLSIIMAISISILLTHKKLFSNKLRILLIVLFSSILVLTNSRTGIAAAAVILILSFLVKFNFKVNILKVVSFLLLATFTMGVIKLLDLNYVNKFLSRFTIQNIAQDRHFLVPIEGIIIWLSSVKNFIFGIGYGSSINITGKFTYLPPYFLNSFVTLIAEKGLTGLLIVLEFIRLFIMSLKTVKNKYISHAYYSISYAFMILFASFFFYEAKQNISVWVIIGIVYLMDKHRKFSPLEEGHNAA